MKKILLSVIVLLSILTSFIGCEFRIANDYASQELKSPEVEEIDSGIAIRLPVPSDPVSSILIYRYEEEIKTEESSSETQKSVTHRSTKDNKLASSDIIGYINVEKLKSSDVFSYFFEDKLVELNKKYEYKARYTYKDSTQKYTKWSTSVDRILNKNPAYTPTEGPILAEFNKDEMELTFQLEKTVKVEDNYRYSMIITAKPNKNEEKYVTQLFEITAPTMYLTKVLPSSFLEATGEVWLAGVVENEYLAFTDNIEKKEESLQEKENESEKTKNDTTTPETSAGEVIDENITEITEESENSNGNSNNAEVDKDGDEKEETTPEASVGEIDENGDKKEDNNTGNNDSQTETTVVMKKIPTKIGFSKKIPVEIEGIPSTEEGSKIIDADITYDDNSYGIDFSKQAIKLQ